MTFLMAKVNPFLEKHLTRWTGAWGGIRCRKDGWHALHRQGPQGAGPPVWEDDRYAGPADVFGLFPGPICARMAMPWSVWRRRSLTHVCVTKGVQRGILDFKAEHQIRVLA